MLASSYEDGKSKFDINRVLKLQITSLKSEMDSSTDTRPLIDDDEELAHDREPRRRDSTQSDKFDKKSKPKMMGRSSLPTFSSNNHVVVKIKSFRNRNQKSNLNNKVKIASPKCENIAHVPCDHKTNNICDENRSYINLFKEDENFYIYEDG